jgi:hypothetical protein
MALNILYWPRDIKIIIHLIKQLMIRRIQRHFFFCDLTVTSNWLKWKNNWSAFPWISPLVFALTHRPLNMYTFQFITTELALVTRHSLKLIKTVFQNSDPISHCHYWSQRRIAGGLLFKMLHIKESSHISLQQCEVCDTDEFHSILLIFVDFSNGVL